MNAKCELVKCSWILGLAKNSTEPSKTTKRQMYSCVKLNFKAGLFSSSFYLSISSLWPFYTLKWNKNMQ